MPNKYDNRRVRLQRLVKNLNERNGRGGVRAVVVASGVANSTVHHVIHEAHVGVGKGLGRRIQVHQLGDDAARKIEAAFAMAPGELSSPLENELEAGPGRNGLDLMLWLREALDTGVVDEIDAQFELARFRDLYPGVSPNRLIFGTSGCGKTKLAAVLQAG